MSEQPIVIYGFETSNNLKVRVALLYKGIAHEFCTIDPADRSKVVEVSGQFLTPVMVHGATVLFDSAAILRYLDANFPRTPKLFGKSRDEQWAIEDWERFGRGPLAEPMMRVVHARVQGHAVVDELREAAVRDLAAAVEHLARGLAGRTWLVGESMSAADITCGAVIERLRRSGTLPLPAAADAALALAERVFAGRGV
jgi:glutathione S-transferase